MPHGYKALRDVLTDTATAPFRAAGPLLAASVCAVRNRRDSGLFVMFRNSTCQLEPVWNDPQTAPGNERARLHSVRVIPKSVDQAGQINVSSPIRLEFCY
jgi:hypothetical protein